MITLVWALCALQILDLGTTWLGLNAGAQEANPFGVWLLGHGFEGLVVAKFLATVIAISLAYFLWRKHPRMALTGLKINVGIMAAVVIFNVVTVVTHG